jgi:hypothetical protein
VSLSSQVRRAEGQSFEEANPSAVGVVAYALRPQMAAAAILPELGTQVLIPVAAAVGIAFSVLQWVLVSKVRLAPERRADGGGAVKSGPSDYLIEEEEGLNDHNVVVKCAEIQNAISEGEKPGAVFL